MSRRTRYFLLISGLIVVGGLGTGLVAMYTTGGLSALRNQTPSEFAYVPADATAVAYADVRHIMDSEFRQRLRAALPDDKAKAKDEFLAETGIDIERDIDTVVAGITSEAMNGRGPVILLRGRFDAARVEQAAVKHGATVEEYKGRRFLRAPEGEAGEQPAIAFLEPGLVALGAIDRVKQSVDAAERGETITSNRELMKLITDVDRSSDAWVAGRLQNVPGHQGWPDAVKDQLGAVQWFALSAGVDRALTARLRAEARDAKAAEDLRGVVNGAISMARMMAGKDAKLSGMLDSIQATGSGTQMEVSFTVPPDVIDMMAGQHGLPLQTQ
jgi:hypothetical protein